MKTGQPKNIQKSIRISEEVAAYIEKHYDSANFINHFMQNDDT